MNPSTLPPAYDPANVETKWYALWEQAGLFSPTPNSDKPSFTITIPPPNITGSLHMGHALCYPIQDLIGRYRRLKGDNVLIVPGQDHAGIATQSVVTKHLKAQGIQAADLGRDGFVEKVWEWRKESGDAILHQFRALGCAFDWTRTQFTLDDHYHDAVLKVFIDWFEKGLIYRGKRVVNWDPVLKTTVSDIETERETVNGKLYHIRYPFADNSGFLIVATTRPETMLGDVAVAVHPDDARYKGLVGKQLQLPLAGRTIPLLADIYPDPEFGTGAVKITPAHDPNDYEVGVRHGLEMPVILDQSAKIDLPGSPYHGLDRYEARKRIVADLEAAELLEKVEDHSLAVLVSSRSGQVIEPLLSEQWFARQTELAEPAIRAVESGEIRFHPERYAGIYLHWMRNIRDWNISRQLWWGHRIPVYYDAEGNPTAALSWQEAEAKAGKPMVRQDDDVLDTWFSSGLWPFTVLGWPENTPDLTTHYPTNVLVTARDIIYLWVARMAMMSLYFTGKVPFRDVFIYATVLTESGQRMSKSLGTGIDPLTVIDTKGADALRFTLLGQTGENQEIRYSERKTDDARNFCNKMWNAARFLLMNLGETPPAEPATLETVDRWLLSRIATLEKLVDQAYADYDLQKAAQALYAFFWSDLCDWYIEVAKPRLNDPDRKDTPCWVMLQAFDAFLKMMHPLMPHITEEIYSHLPLPEKVPFLMAAAWPKPPAAWQDPAAEATFAHWQEIVRGLRALRAELGLPALRTIPLAVTVGDLRGGEEIIRSQAWIEALLPTKPTDRKLLAGGAAGVDLYLPIEGLIDEAKEIERVQKEIEKLAKEVAKLDGQLANQSFIQNAKPEAIDKARQDASQAHHRLQRLRERLEILQS